MKNFLSNKFPKKVLVLISVILVVSIISTMFILNLNAAPVTAGNYTVDYNIQNSWGNGATVSVKLSNSGPAIQSWKIVWTFPGDQKITNMWNASYTQSGASVTVNNVAWNGSIPTNGSQTFGFNLTYSGSNTAPTSFTVNSSSSSTTTTIPTTTVPTTTVPTTTASTTTIVPSTTAPTTTVPVTTAPTNITIPSYSSLQSNAKMPDPFMFMNGSRMTRKDQWAARKAEIIALSQAYEFGVKPPKPSTVTGSFSSNRITVTCSEGGKSISFSASITYPSSGTAPYPAIIGIGASSLNNSELSRLGVAVINFPNDEIANQTNSSSRGKGKFYDLYGSNHSAGALMAWSWGVSRLIDALEQTPSANINASKLGVTGCSRNGKGALVAGAFEERIALTIPQESGSGGAASWRVSDAQKASGQNVQTLSQIVTENCWFRQDFSQFGSTANKLPYDHHAIAALCAPRALLIIENTSMEWLGNVSCYSNAVAAHMVWEALGVPDKMGFSQVGHSDHCGFPSSQQPELTAYIQKFLIGNGSGNTTIMKTDGGFTFDKAKWVDWTIPTLQ